MKSYTVSLVTKQVVNNRAYAIPTQSRKWHIKGEMREGDMFNTHTFCGKETPIGFEYVEHTAKENEFCSKCLRLYLAYCRRHGYTIKVSEE
jgi:hypothetical protein